MVLQADLSMILRTCIYYNWAVLKSWECLYMWGLVGDRQTSWNPKGAFGIAEILGGSTFLVQWLGVVEHGTLWYKGFIVEPSRKSTCYQIKKGSVFAAINNTTVL